MSKALKVISINTSGMEQEVMHGIGETISTDAYTVAILRGVLNAGHTIKAFDVVEV